MRVIDLAESQEQATHAIVRLPAHDKLNYTPRWEALILPDDNIRISAEVLAEAHIDFDDLDYREESILLVPAAEVPQPLMTASVVPGRLTEDRPAAWVVVTSEAGDR